LSILFSKNFYFFSSAKTLAAVGFAPIDLVLQHQGFQDTNECSAKQIFVRKLRKGIMSTKKRAATDASGAAKNICLVYITSSLHNNLTSIGGAKNLRSRRFT
jgi:hypothetical protein